MDPVQESDPGSIMGHSLIFLVKFQPFSFDGHDLIVKVLLRDLNITNIKISTSLNH